MSATQIETTIASETQDVITHLPCSDKKHDLTAIIHYHKASPDGSTATAEKYSLHDPDHHDPRTAIIYDVRGSEADYTLENNGFQYLRCEKPMNIDFSNDEQIKKDYYPVMEAFLKNT